MGRLEDKTGRAGWGLNCLEEAVFPILVFKSPTRNNAMRSGNSCMILECQTRSGFCVTINTDHKYRPRHMWAVRL